MNLSSSVKWLPQTDRLDNVNRALSAARNCQCSRATLAVTAQLEASQVELTVLHRNGAFFDLTRIHFCVPAATIEPTGQLATLTQPTP